MAAPNDPPPNIQSNTNANAGLSNVTEAHIQSDRSSKQEDAQFLCILNLIEDF